LREQLNWCAALATNTFLLTQHAQRIQNQGKASYDDNPRDWDSLPTHNLGSKLLI
jgi:hypothetical protein